MKFIETDTREIEIKKKKARFRLDLGTLKLNLTFNQYAKRIPVTNPVKFDTGWWIPMLSKPRKTTISKTIEKKPMIV